MKRDRSGNPRLRTALDAPDGFDRHEHRQLVADVERVHPHNVTYRELIDESTCVTYAFGLFKDQTYRAVAGDFGGRIFAGRRFIEWLLEHGHLNAIGRAVARCLALYFADGVWQHAGIVSGAGRITSQWGTFPVYEHGVFEVPARYGNEVRFFTKLHRADALRLFLNFSKTCGLSDADIARAIRNA